jgi:type 1 glutamine amidotransferase
LLTGGCCHDYKTQTEVIKKFTSDKLNITWDVLHEGGKGGDHKFSIYSEKDWAKKYDVVVHNECFARTKDDGFIKKVVADHIEAGIGVIMVHCAMHTFRDAKEGTAAWCKLIGLKSRSHEHQAEYAVENINETHPIMKGFPQVWQAPKDELYVVLEEGPNMVPLARAYGERSKKFSTCIWTNEVGKSKVFGITFGHNTSTMQAKVFQGVFNRGLLWTTGHLTSNGETEVGYSKK